MRQRGVSAFVLGPILLGQALMSVVLGGNFGDASAEGRALTSGEVEVELTVEVENAQSVIAHLIDAGGTQESIPLVPRGNDLYSATIEIRKADFVVVFEALGQALSTQSQPARLTELGLDPLLIGAVPISTTVPPPDEVDSETSLWGWAGLGLAALSLAFLAWWALPETKKDEEDIEVS